MSIVAIRKKMGTGMKYVLGAVLVILLVGIFVSFSGGGLGGRGQQRQGPTGPPVMATVNGKALSRVAFGQRMYLAEGRSASQQLAADRQNKLLVLEQFIVEVLMDDAIRQQGIKVSREEVNQALEQSVQERLAELFPSPTGGFSKKKLKEYLDSQNLSYEDFLARLRAEQEERRDYIARMIEEQKLRAKIIDSVQVTEQQLKESYKQVKARHLLVAPEPATPQKPPQVQRAAAKQEAEKLLAQLKSGADFAQLAKQYSHDDSSRAQGGQLKELTRDEVLREFVAWSPRAIELLQQPQGYAQVSRDVRKITDQLFARPKGSLTPIIETDAGFHLFQVEDVQVKLPKNFETSKKQLLQIYRQRQQYEAWADFDAGLREAAKIVVEDPELKAYQAMDAGDYKAAYPLLLEALKYTQQGGHPGDPAINYQLGQAAEKLDNPQQAVTHYLASEKAAGASPDLHLALGQLYRKQKKQQQALKEFQEAHEAAETLAPENRSAHEELKAIYKEMGQKQLAAKQQAWLDQLAKEMETALAERAGAPGSP